ncbi:MAG: FtsX-like permease family protein [Clostridiales bacterium]|nr:FtsX-like permease family protein [Clostridiales bacterium]
MKTPGAKRYFLRMAFGSLGAQKKRYFTLASGILLAIFFASTMIWSGWSIFKSMQAANIARIGSQDAALLDSQETAATLLESGLAERAGEIWILGEIASSTEADASRAPVAMFDTAAMEISPPNCLEGRLPEKAGEIAVEKAAFAKFRLDGASIGDTITFYQYPLMGNDTLAKEAVEQTYILTGILSDKSEDVQGNSYSFFGGKYSTPYPSAVVSTEEEIIPGSLPARHIYFEAAPFVSYNTVQRAFPDEGIDVYSLSGGNLYSNANREMMAMIYSVAIIGLALVAAACFGIVNSFNANLASRSVQIGMMRAVGATRRQISSIFMTEAMIIAVIIAPLAIILSGGAVWCVCKILSGAYRVYVSWPMLIIDAVFSILCTLIAAAIPLRRAGRTSPIQAVRDTPLLRASRQTKLNSKEIYSPAKLITGRFMRMQRAHSVGIALLLTASMLCISIGTLLVEDTLDTLTSETVYDYQIENYNFSRDYWAEENALQTLYTESDRAEILSLPMVERVEAIKSTAVNIAMDEVTHYVGIPNDFLLTDAERVEVFQRPADYRNVYLEEKAALGIEKDLVPGRIAVISEARIAELQKYVLDGEIDIDAINAGREILLVAPEAIYIEVSPDGGGWATWTHATHEVYHYSYTHMSENDMFAPGQNLELIRLYTDHATEENIPITDYIREDYNVTVGAILSSGVNGFGSLGTMYTTFAGANAMGIPLGGYYRMDIALSGTPEEDTEARISEAIESISQRVENGWFRSQFRIARNARENLRQVVLISAVVLILFTAIAISMIGNAVSGRIRADKRTIGTLRAVGASMDTVLAVYRRQVALSLSIGLGLGLAASEAWVLLMMYGPVPASVWLVPCICIGYALIVFGACVLQLKSKLRSVMRASIVENIREL